VVNDAISNRLSMLLLYRVTGYPLCLFCVAQETTFDKNRWHVGVLENAEVGFLQAACWQSWELGSVSFADAGRQCVSACVALAGEDLPACRAISQPVALVLLAALQCIETNAATSPRLLA
jgi:hypothetical protein